MKYVKITPGYVLQIFNDVGECINQTFHIDSHGEVIYETDMGDPIKPNDMPLGGREYQPFTMEQP